MCIRDSALEDGDGTQEIAGGASGAVIVAEQGQGADPVFLDAADAGDRAGDGVIRADVVGAVVADGDRAGAADGQCARRAVQGTGGQGGICLLYTS